MKLTISPTLALPSRCSKVPVTTIAITASVLAPRVSTLTTAHQFSTGNWWRIRSSTICPKIRLSAASRVKLCTTMTFESASCAVPARAEW